MTKTTNSTAGALDLRAVVASANFGVKKRGGQTSSGSVITMAVNLPRLNVGRAWYNRGFRSGRVSVTESGVVVVLRTATYDSENGFLHSSDGFLSVSCAGAEVLKTLRSSYRWRVGEAQELVDDGSEVAFLLEPVGDQWRANSAK